MQPARLTSATNTTNAANDAVATRKFRHGQSHAHRLPRHRIGMATTIVIQTNHMGRNGQPRGTSSRQTGAPRLLARLPAWVVTVTENGTAEVVTSNAVAGTAQVASAGVPEQVIDTSPVN